MPSPLHINKNNNNNDKKTRSYILCHVQLENVNYNKIIYYTQVLYSDFVVLCKSLYYYIPIMYRVIELT